MLKILLDHNFDHHILRGLRRRIPEFDFQTAHEIGLSQADDRQLLIWAAENGRVLLTHDNKTMPRHYAALLSAGMKIAGIIVLPKEHNIGLIIDELEIFVVCTDNDEWTDRLQILWT